MPDTTDDNISLLKLTSEIVSAHVSNNSVQLGDLQQLIGQVYQSLSMIGRTPPVKSRRQPAVPISRSVRPDYIVCLEDGVKLKTLKRHLMSAYDLTPQAYRERWGLPSNYPIVAPNYALHRSRLAKKIGLGKRPRRNGRAAAA